MYGVIDSAAFSWPRRKFLIADRAPSAPMRAVPVTIEPSKNFTVTSRLSSEIQTSLSRLPYFVQVQHSHETTIQDPIPYLDIQSLRAQGSQLLAR